MLHLITALLAKAGAATVTTKFVVAGAVSAAALGTAGATGAVPVDALLPGADTSVTVRDHRSGEDTRTDLDSELLVDGVECDVDAREDSDVDDGGLTEVKVDCDAAEDDDAAESGEDADEATDDNTPEREAERAAAEEAEEAEEAAERAAEEAEKATERAAEEAERAAERAAEEAEEAAERAAEEAERQAEQASDDEADEADEHEVENENENENEKD